MSSDTRLQQQISMLKFALVAVLVINGFVIFSSFQQNSHKRFDEITVRRLNLVEEDGKVKLIIANKKRLPGAITNGRLLDDPKGERGPGLIIYNDDGDEAGGYLFGNWGSHFSMDQLKQDQAVYMQVINGEKGEPLRTAGFWVTPRSNRFSSDMIDSAMDSINAIADKVIRDKARSEFWKSVDSYNRAFMGKNRNDETGLFLYDKQFKTRMRVYIDTIGNPRMEFLDEKGVIFFSLPK